MDQADALDRRGVGGRPAGSNNTPIPGNRPAYAKSPATREGGLPARQCAGRLTLDQRRSPAQGWWAATHLPRGPQRLSRRSSARGDLGLGGRLGDVFDDEDGDVVVGRFVADEGVVE